MDTLGAEEAAARILRSKTRGKAFDAITAAAYAAILKPGDVAVDGGANRGLHTLPMARCVGPQGLILAFEPIPLLAENLRTKLASEQVSNTEVIEAALSHTAGIASFTYVTNHAAYSGLLPRDYPFEPVIDKIEVKTVLMDDYFPVDRPLPFIKLDLEGGEFRALQGAERIMREKRPLIEFENGTVRPAETYGYTSAEFFAFFDSLDYRLFDIFGRAFDPPHWGAKGRAWNFFAVPRERVEEVEELLKNIVHDIATRFGEASA